MIQIFSGQNEGKSIAAYDVAREAIARKKTVCVMVLFKGKHYPGKLKKLVSRGAHVYMFMPRFPKLDNEESLGLAQKKGVKVIEHIKKIVTRAKTYDVVILDEIIVALNLNLIDTDQLITLLQSRGDIDFVLTGWNPPQELLSIADKVTEVRINPVPKMSATNSSMNLFCSNEVRKCIDDSGNINVSDEMLKQCIKNAEKLTKRLLGCTLVIREKRFILTVLELYYGGVRDLKHDWHKKRFGCSSKKMIEHTEIQSMEGMKIYLSSLKRTQRQRIDVVIGPKDVPISVLIRNAFDLNNNITISNKKYRGELIGEPNKTLNRMGIQSEDHGEEILYVENDTNINTTNKYFLIDTHSKYIKGEGLIQLGKRYNASENSPDLRWRFWINSDHLTLNAGCHSTFNPDETI